MGKKADLIIMDDIDTKTSPPDVPIGTTFDHHDLRDAVEVLLQDLGPIIELKFDVETEMRDMQGPTGTSAKVIGKRSVYATIKVLCDPGHMDELVKDIRETNKVHSNLGMLLSKDQPLAAPVIVKDEDTGMYFLAVPGAKVPDNVLAGPDELPPTWVIALETRLQGKEKLPQG